ncbi:MAG TPA: NAD-dependent epimerase/dehydratase family protein, partial [Chthoniobacterales bacterium]
MARVLIAGCGYAGEAAATHFHQSGWQVEGWTASAESAAKLSGRPYEVHGVDVTDDAAVEARAALYDVIVHCVSSRGGDEQQYRRLYFDGVRNLLRVFARSTLIFTSSTSVYAQRDGTVVDENSPAEPAHAKGKILRETEELVLKADGIIARLGGIHGPGRSALLSKFLEGAPLAGPADRFINQVHRDDIASALVLLAEERVSAKAEIFNVVGDRPIRAQEADEWLRSRLKRPSVQATKSAPERKR